MTAPRDNGEPRFNPETDREALIALYEATGGDGWRWRDGWLGGDPIGTWEGVHADADGRVWALDLVGNVLSGAIPESLGDLTQLTRLQLGYNQLSGAIPESLGNLTQLTQLGLFENQLSGAIPESLGNLTQLTQLWLHANELSGAIPESLGNLTQLTQLWLHANELSGAIPESLGNLTQLTQLWLHANELSGAIPESLGNLTQLTVLGLHQNELSGAIPESLGNLTELTQLWLHANELSEAIPESLGNLTQLIQLGLHANQLSGAIPESLGNLTQLTQLGLFENHLSGAIPESLGNLSNLEYLNLGGMDLRNENLQGGRADLFNVDVTGLGGADFAELVELSPTFWPGAAFPPEDTDTESTAGVESPEGARESATFHIFSLHPIELYDRDVAEHVANMFPRPESEGTHHECPDELHECDFVPFDLDLLVDLKMKPAHMFKGRQRRIGGQLVREYAMLMGTVLCIVYHATTGITTSHPEDTRLYKRIKWALSMAETPPQWVRDALPYNSMGALYRAAWTWMYQRYIWSQWIPESVDGVAGGIHRFADENERAIEEGLSGELQSSKRLMKVVGVITRDHPRIFTFSAVEIVAEDNEPEPPRSDSDDPDGQQSPDPLWREHFSTTAHALDILNALDDGVHLSQRALEEFESDGVYRTLQRTHTYLQDLMSSSALENPSESLRGERFEEVARQLVDGLSQLDLERVRKSLLNHQPLRSHEDHKGAAKPDWLDVQDGDQHLFVHAEPDLVTITTASSRHIDEIVAMEIALQSAWNGFARASGRVLEAHESKRAGASDEDAGFSGKGADNGGVESGRGNPSELPPMKKRWAAKIAAPGRILVDWLRPGGDDDLEASDEEDALLDAMSDQLLRVTRWRAQVSGWRRVVFEQLRRASGLDENIDAFYRASEESVKRSEVLREKVRAERQRAFQAAVALAALALAAVVLGEIAISIENEADNAVPRAAAWIVGLGLVLIAWFIAKSLSGQPSALSRGVGWFWERMSESIAALLLVGLMAAFLYESLGGGPPQGTPEWLGRAIASLATAIVFGMVLRAWRERWIEILVGLLVGFAALAWALDEFLGGSPFWRVDSPFWKVWTGIVTLAAGAGLGLLVGWLVRAIPRTADDRNPPTANRAGPGTGN